jgi:hypothetical protein
MWEFLVCEAPLTSVRHPHEESYTVEPSAEAQAGAGRRVTAAISIRNAYGLSRE